MHVDLSDNPFIAFLECDVHGGIEPYRSIQNAFSYQVQMVSRSFQSANLDEPVLSILLYKCITETVPHEYRHHFAEINRNSLLADLNRVDELAYQQTLTISELIHQGTRFFKEAISGFYII
uniref:Type II toxin-antitoxin system HipA family toxin n=1 Tax=Caenorhabditis tropicalis TaxID=1561998 RepID=A0A1I7UX97_9PELO